MAMCVDSSMRILACSYISQQLNKLMKHLHGAETGEDMEDIHQARVACRRIIAAIDLFYDCFNANLISTWHKHIRKLLKSFGQARDIDVQILFLEQRVKTLTSQKRAMKPGLQRMLLRCRQKRQEIQPHIVKVVDKIRKKHILRNIHLELERVSFIYRRARKPKRSAAIYRRAYDSINAQIEKLFKQLPYMDDPSDIKGHHELRITFKELRYIMEICNKPLRGQLRPVLKRVKKLQTLLGDIHDCDVWQETIDCFIEQEKARVVSFYGDSKPMSRIQNGLKQLKLERAELRGELFNKALDIITKLNRHNYWNRLLNFLRTLAEAQLEI